MLARFVPVKPTPSADNYQCFETTTIFYVSAFQYMTLAFAYSKGPPFRKRIWSNGELVVVSTKCSCTCCLPTHDGGLLCLCMGRSVSYLQMGRCFTQALTDTLLP